MDYWNFNRLGLRKVLPELGRIVSEPLNLVDGGGAGSLPQPFANLESPQVIRAYRFEPRGQGEVDESSASDTVLPWALSDGQEKLTIYLTASPTSSSSHKPDHLLLAKFLSEHSEPRRVVDTAIVDAKSIDEMVKMGLMPTPDFIKLDIQGGEFSALSGAFKSLDSCLGVLVEGWHQQVHSGQRVLSQVDSLLQEKGFELYDSVCAARWRHGGHRGKATRVDRGQFIGSESLYIKRNAPLDLMPKKILILLAFGFSVEALRHVNLLKKEDRDGWSRVIFIYQRRMRRSPWLLIRQVISVLNSRLNGG